jgi:diadenosine tetraphosphate (Ap4A) HIT family hydrolase
MRAPYDLDPRLEESSVPVVDWPVCELRLRDDSRFPWLLLVPRKAGVVEFTDLTEEEYAQVAREILAATRLVQRVAKPDKVNVGMLGNVVPQMHIHVVGRFRDDPAWPDPIWSAGVGAPYPHESLRLLAADYARAATDVLPRP